VGRDFPPVQTGPGAHPATCTMGTGSFPGIKYGRGVLLTTHPLLVPWSWKNRAIPLPTLWATTGSVTGTLYIYQYHNLMGPPSYVRSVVDLKVVIRRIPVNQDSDTDNFKLVYDVISPLVVSVGNMVSANGR